MPEGRAEVAAIDARDVFPGDSESSRLLREVDWANTPLGDLAEWPQSLRTSISICLNSAFPILVWWGPELVMLYNDAYAPIISNKHPAALGSPGRRVFPEIWDTIGPMLTGVMDRTQAVRAEDLGLLLERNGYSEECYFTFSYSPILDESGRVGGVFTPVHETTERVIGERRFKTLSRLSEVRSGQAPNVASACAALIDCLAGNPVDIPFGAIYLFAPGSSRAYRSAATGDHSEQLAPKNADEQSAWPPVRAVLRGEVTIRDREFLDAGAVPMGPTGQSVEQIVVTPLKGTGLDGITGFLVAALNPRKRFNDAYGSFLSLVAEHVSGAITDARALDHERKRVEALAEIDLAKTVFFSNVSHEFRTPLTLMAGPLQELIEDPNMPEQARERLQLARRNVQRLQKLVNNLLDFSRLEAGHVRGAFEPVDLVELTRSLVESFRSAFEKAGLSLDVVAREAIPEVFVDRELWEEIILNLVSNAFKFTFEGGVRVEFSRQGESVQVSVEDTGTGIPAAELPNVFQRFHRVQGAIGRSFEGSGIGLALAQELVKLHHGTIAVRSEPGTGSTFTITLPLGHAHLHPKLVRSPELQSPASRRTQNHVDEALLWIPDASQPAPRSASPLKQESAIQYAPEAPDGRKTVLVIDDNPDMRQYLSQLLSPQFAVETAVNGAEGFARVVERRPDLVLTDAMMPVMNGIDLLKAIRRDPALSSLPVIVLSARAEEESGIQALELGADDYITKPFPVRELLARVSSTLKIAEFRASAESLLREREQELRYTVELNPQIQWTADAAGRLLDISSKWLELTGQSHAAALQAGWNVMQHPGRDKTAQTSWMNSVESGEPLDCEHRVLTSDGRSLWMRLRAFPRRDDTGRVVKWYGTIEDIDNRKRTEHFLQDSERRTRIAQEAAGVLIWEWGEGDERIAWGPGVERLYGRPAEELDFPTWIESLHPDDRQPTLARLSESVRTLTPYDTEYRVRWPDGSMHWLISKGEVTRLSETGRTFFIGANIDITLRRNAEQALLESESQLREVLERTNDAVFVLNFDWRFAYLNHNAVQLIASGRDLVGKNIWEEFPEAIDRHFDAEYHRAMDDRIPTQFEEYYPEPLDKWFDVHAYPTREGIAVFFRDVTTRRKSEQALRLSEKLAAAGRLAASIAHEINNPLEAVTNLLYILESDSGLTPAGLQFLKTAEGEVARVSHIANQTLRFYRQSTRPTRVMMSDVLESVISLHNLRHRDPGIIFDRRYRHSEPFVAFEGELRQVFANLIGNAADALLPNGRIVLRIQNSMDWRNQRKGVRVTVADNGHGMNRETVRRLFEPFFSTKGTIGTGLGLWVSKEIVEKHGGFIRMRSSQTLPRNGTSFTVFLPYETARTTTPVT